ncbi:MAG TPA: DUF1573 domain-containing protein [Chitinophagaceae bacterium]|nr:DUF1573 domain-containing protein [Chitinophagaceae bacterium]
MKKIFIILAAGISLLACQTNDKKTTAGTEIPKEERDKALKDSANFTTVEWLDSTYKDLGKVKEGQQVEVSFRFKNTGTKNLVIDDVTASCGCTVPEKPQEPITPGQEGMIKAKFDSKGKPVGEARKEVYVTANTTPSTSHTLTFRVEITN